MRSGFARVGQGDDEGMIAPGAVIGDVHAFFALTGGGDERAVGIEDGLVKEVGGLMLPDTDAHVVVDVLQRVDVSYR